MNNMQPNSTEFATTCYHHLYNSVILHIRRKEITRPALISVRMYSLIQTNKHTHKSYNCCFTKFDTILNYQSF